MIITQITSQQLCLPIKRQHKIKPFNIPAYIGEGPKGLIIDIPVISSWWLQSWESHSPLRTWSLLGCTYPIEELHTYVYIDMVYWAQRISITENERKTQYWEDEEGTRTSQREVMVDGYDQQMLNKCIHFSKNKF